MGYKEKASKISQKYADVTTSLGYVKQISFDDNWKGKAKESLIPALKKAIEELEKVGNSIKNLIACYDEYVEEQRPGLPLSVTQQKWDKEQQR